MAKMKKRRREPETLLSSSRPLALRIEYNGANFFGSQLQPNVRTVQGELERSISCFTGEGLGGDGGGVPRVVLASRTDKGVHARGQRGLVRTRSPLDADSFCRGLDSFLPDDLAVREVNECEDEGWDPRASATGKLYRYSILCGPSRPVLSPLRNLAWYVKSAGIGLRGGTGGLDVERMRLAAASLVSHPHGSDFTSFGNRDKGRSAENPVCCIELLSVDVAELPGEDSLHLVTIDVRADRFVYKMIRNIVGSLVEIGRHGRAVKLARGDEASLDNVDHDGGMSALLAARDRTVAPQGAPALGLCLVDVYYGKGHRKQLKATPQDDFEGVAAGVTIPMAKHECAS